MSSVGDKIKRIKRKSTRKPTEAVDEFMGRPLVETTLQVPDSLPEMSVASTQNLFALGAQKDRAACIP